MRQVLFAHDDETARHAIEAMNDAGTQKPRPGGLPVEMRLECVAQRARLHAARGMNNLSGGLVDDDDPGILEDDGERQLLGSVQFVRRLDEPHRNGIPLVDAFVDPHGHAVDLDLTGVDHPLDAEGRVIAKVANEKRIDPHAAEVTLDDQLGREGKRTHSPIFTRSIDIGKLTCQNEAGLSTAETTDCLAKEVAMRMLMHIKMPHEPFNAAVRDGSVGKKLKRILEETKPEATYFTEFDGRRGAILIVDVPDPSKIPALAEPWFLTFNADVEAHIVMTPDDLARAGLDAIGKKWS